MVLACLDELHEGIAAGIYVLRRLKFKRCGELALGLSSRLTFASGTPSLSEKSAFRGLVRDHKKANAKRWIVLNMRDSAGSPVMGVRGKYEGPIRDHKKGADPKGQLPVFWGG